MERDFRAIQIYKYIKYIFLIKFLYEYFKYVNFLESGLDEPVDKTAADSSINVLNGGTNISGSISYSDNNRIALLTPSSALTQGVTLTVQVTTGLKDVSGNALANEFDKDFVYSGSDQIVFDKGSPEVESIEQKSGEYFITFTEEIDSSSILNSVEIKTGTDTITGTVTLESSKSIKFVPENSLSNNASYEFIVKTDIKDISGKSIALFNSVFTYTSSDKVIYERPGENEHNESVIGNTTLFQGREYESETGLYYFRARYFHPKLGRFLQPDPKGYVDSTNLYQSFNQNPVNFTDPMGTKTDFNYYGTKKTYSEALRDWKVGEDDWKILLTCITAPLSAVSTVYDKLLDVADWGARKIGISKNEGEFRQFLDFALKVTPFLGGKVQGVGTWARSKLDDVFGALKNTGVKMGQWNKALGTSGHIGENLSKRAVVFGQNMPDRVVPVAQKLNAVWFKGKWSWPKNLKFLRKNIDNVKKGTGKIFDIGWEKGRYHGPKSIYIKEKKELIEAGLKRVFTGRWITTENGKKFRLYEWVLKNGG